MIPKETIAIIIETADVVEVLGEFVSLKKKGKDYWACCPFHNEKTPSFSVSHKGFYKCFGCGESGNAINFLMEHEHYTYPEALKYLANKYNIEIQEQELTPEMEQQQNEREALYIVSAYAEKFFIEQLNDTDEGKSIGLSYFKERGFSNETIEKFKLGYCPDQWDVLTKTALDAGYKLEYLLQTGLSKERNNQHYDGYRGRVIFPIHNLSGRPIAFGGRTLKTDKKIPKYVNTSECDIYHKSKVLYGIYFAKKAIISEDNCYLVEGYTDVISLHQSGIENVVASSGTSLTIEQIRLIKRYTPNITILYDGDAAGIKASFRGIDLILEEGMNVKIVLFPEGEDPDSYAKKSSPEELKEFITSSSKDFIVFKTETLQIESQNDPVKKAGLIHEIINSIALIPDHIARSLYLKECSKILGISEKALIGELNKTLRKKFKQKFKKEEGFEPDLPVIELKAQPQFQPDDSCEYQEKDIIRLLLNYCGKKFSLPLLNEENEEIMTDVEIDKYLINELISDNLKFKNLIYQQIVDEFLEAYENEKSLTSEHFIHHTNLEVQKVATDLLSEKYKLDNWEKKQITVTTEDMQLKRAAEEGSYAYKLKKLQEMIKSEEEKLKEFQNNTERQDEMMAYLKRLRELKDLKRKISVKIGRHV